MLVTVLPVLAAEWGELVVVSIGLVIMIGSWIVNQIKQSKTTEPTRGSGPSKQIRLEDLAARRREQLQQMAGSRSGASPTPSSPPQAEPQNLTLAERIERARAQVTYRLRAEGLGGQDLEPKPPPQLQSRPSQTAQPSVPRPQPPRAASPRPVQPAPFHPGMPSTRPVVMLKPREASPPRRLRRGQTEDADDTKPKTLGKLKVSPNAPGGRPMRVQPFGGQVLGVKEALRGPSLRQAIVLKEILRHPVGFRESPEPGD